MKKRIITFAACLIIGVWVTPKQPVFEALPVGSVGTIPITDNTGTKWVIADTTDGRCAYDPDSLVRLGGKARISGQARWNGVLTCVETRNGANPLDTSTETR